MFTHKTISVGAAIGERILKVTPLILLAVLATRVASAVPNADLWEIWDRSDESNPAVVNHSLWNTLLGRFLVVDDPAAVNLVRYSMITGRHREVLERYLAELQKIDPRDYGKSEQLAYWINFYNALTVRVVLDHPDKTTILRMGRRWFSIGPWNDALAEVAGHPLTLNDIEHRIVRPIWHDRRIHYAVNCASIGCPDLADRAYTGADLEAMLDDAETSYLNHPRGVSFVKDRLHLSRIFNWFRADFAPSQAELLDYLADHRAGAIGERVRSYRGRINYDYDWELNKPRATGASE